MAFIRTILLATIVLCYALATNISIRERTRSGNTVRFDCIETMDNGAHVTITNPMWFYLNSSSLVVTTLLQDRGIEYTFESGEFSFNVRQDLEGCYYCGNSTSLSPSCKTIVAYPDRDRSIPRHYEVAVGEHVRLLNGVGEGALASHYSVIWYKGVTVLRETDGISYDDGEDFSLSFASVKMLDSGTYHSRVTVSRGSEEHYVEPEILIELVVYRSPQIITEPSSVVEVQNNGVHKNVSFLCVASGGPNLRVSWMKNMNRNLTSVLDSRYHIKPASVNDTVTSRLVIENATHLDSGSFHCVAYILDRVDESSSKFVTVANATLTVLDTKFRLQTRVTQDRELQIWINLQAPLPDPVRAMVCFTSTEDKEIQRHHETSSSQTNSTALFFLLHFPDIPEDIRDSSFKVQVALKVRVTEGPLVPSSLEDADTRNINEPSKDSSEECDILKVAIIAGSIAAPVTVITAVCVLLFCCYKWKDKAGRRKHIQNMPKERFDEVAARIDQDRKNVTSDNTTAKKEAEKSLKFWEGVLRGDGSDSKDTTM